MQESPASLGSSMQGKTSEFGINTLLSQWKQHLASKQEKKFHGHHLAKGKIRGRSPPRKRLKAEKHSKGVGSRWVMEQPAHFYWKGSWLGMTAFPLEKKQPQRQDKRSGGQLCSHMQNLRNSRHAGCSIMENGNSLWDPGIRYKVKLKLHKPSQQAQL